MKHIVGVDDLQSAHVRVLSHEGNMAIIHTHSMGVRIRQPKPGGRGNSGNEKAGKYPGL